MSAISPYLAKAFTDKIDRETVKTIIECGARDCLDTLQLLEYYRPDDIFAFECNPESIPICEKNIQDTKIQLIKLAVCDTCGMVDFYPTDMEASNDKNIGASSLLFHRDQDQYIQKKVLVQGITLKAFMGLPGFTKIDLLCMDLQGAEYNAIIGLAERYKDVRYIISEVNYKSFYHNDMLAKDFEIMLKWRGFSKAAEVSYGDFGDALFINTKI